MHAPNLLLESNVEAEPGGIPCSTTVVSRHATEEAGRDTGGGPAQEMEGSELTTVL
jgi:hypothetical protein